MKKEVLIVLVGLIFLVAGYILGSFVPVSGLTTTKLSSDIDTFAYAAGIDMGSSLKEFTVQSKFDEDFSDASFIAGIKAGLNEDESKMSRMDAQMNIQQFVMKQQQSMQAEAENEGVENLIAGQSFLEENKTKKGIVVTESGLQYEILKEGTGVKPLSTDTVEVHYHGTLIDGTVFDSSVDRDETATFAVNAVIPGWTEALQLMPEGSKWKLYIPSELAYGSMKRSEIIKANSTLIFEVELIDVKGK